MTRVEIFKLMTHFHPSYYLKNNVIFTRVIIYKDINSPELVDDYFY